MAKKKKTDKKCDKKCKNCSLFSPEQKLCGVIILMHDGSRVNLPVEPSDDCFFENQFVARTSDGKVETFKPEVQQVRWWVEDPKTGKPTAGNGNVKIEYPDGFFGDESPIFKEEV